MGTLDISCLTGLQRATGIEVGSIVVSCRHILLLLQTTAMRRSHLTTSSHDGRPADSLQSIDIIAPGAGCNMKTLVMMNNAYISAPQTNGSQVQLNVKHVVNNA